MGGTARADADEARRVAALRDLAVLDTPPEERFDRVTRLAQQLFGVQMAFISLVDTDRLFLKSRQGTEARETPREGMFCAAAIQQPATMVVPDAALDPRFTAAPFVTGDPHIRFYAGRPLATAGGERVGTLCLMDRRPREFTAEDEALLSDLAAWVEKELSADAELGRAAEVQRGLLPTAAPDVPGWDLAGACLPAHGVGGDFYDWQAIPGRLLVTLADVMDRGLGAAIIAATVRSVLRGLGRHEDVGEALALAERVLEPDLDRAGAFVTAFHAALDPATGVLRYSDAGHGLAVLRTADGGLHRLSAQGPPLGVVVGEPRAAGEVTLAPGDALAVVSDGVLERGDRALDPEDVLAVPLGAATSAADAVARVLAGAGPATDRPDDLTVVVLRRENG
ncbi:SpoIIE family protein phosphatase [Cellulomonas sp. ACRRI]|uniref:PP2C family protein-serine/threonine phosphatase n=1 Tax=Cellulomonas sp. ACRRI TaxID=2918188 RepID=UPI001EF2C7B9|nr:GAF domain-containing SpoIIE family protein phosphatase [Cellulomonas sp. ACRRI]MCG7287333.1 SpoIIE family protein phosphatase [Cellulomonas sp. ACRRI]